MQVGYIWVSKFDPPELLEMQTAALEAYGIDGARVFVDSVFKTRHDRPGFSACLQQLKEGDVLVVWNLNRLARNVLHLIKLLHEFRQRGIRLHVLSGNGKCFSFGADSCSPSVVIEALVQYERDLNNERTKEAVQDATNNGKRLGRPQAMTESSLRNIQRLMIEGKIPIKAICQQYGLTRQTLYRYLAPSGDLRPEGIRLIGPETNG